MVIILVFIIVALLLVIVWLNIEFYNEKKRFRSRLEKLQEIIAEMDKRQLGNDSQLQLSAALDESLRTNKAILGDQLFSLQQELFEILSKNNLLKK